MPTARCCRATTSLSTCAKHQRSHNRRVALNDELRRLLSSLPHVILHSFGTAPEYEPQLVVESLIWQKYAHSGTCSRCKSWCSIGTTQIGKSPAMPPAIWKNPSGVFAVVFVYHSASSIMYSMPVRTSVDNLFHVA